MTSTPVILAQLDALVEDVAAAQTFEMVALSDFGVVVGYAGEYAALRDDVFATLAFCDAYFPELNVRFDAPQIARGELVSEEKLTAELNALGAELQRIRRILAEAPRQMTNERLQRASAEDRRRFADLLARSGITVESRGAPALEGPPATGDRLLLEQRRNAPRSQGDANAGRSERIYIDKGFSARLADQIADALARTGYDPIMATARPDETIDHCSGGVFSLMPARRAHGASSAAAAIASVIPTIASVREKLRTKLLLVGRAEQAGGAPLPDTLNRAPVFTLKSELMDASEMARFAALTARPIWSAASHPA